MHDDDHEEDHLTEKLGFARWFLTYFLTTEHFKNSITVMIVSVYCYLKLAQIPTGSEYDLLVGMVLGFYFKKDSESPKPKS